MNDFFWSTLPLAWFPVSEIAIVYMVYMLFPWHFSGIIWHPGGIPWNAMDVILFPWHFSEIPWEIPWDTEDWYSDKLVSGSKK